MKGPCLVREALGECSEAYWAAVRQVGGLRDTVTPFDPHAHSGTGWTFDWADAGAFRGALGNALYTYRDYRREFESVQQRGMAQARPAACSQSVWILRQCMEAAGAEQGRPS